MQIVRFLSTGAGGGWRVDDREYPTKRQAIAAIGAAQATPGQKFLEAGRLVRIALVKKQ